MSSTTQLLRLDLKTWNTVRDPDVFATTMVVLAARTFQSFEFVAWDALEIRDSLESRWRRQIPETAFDRLMAGVTLMGTDLFYSNLRAFASLTEVLNGATLVEGLASLPSVAESCWAITEKTLLAPYEDELVDESILIYLRERLKFEGFPTVPDPLRSLLPPEEYQAAFSALDTEDAEMLRVRYAKVQDVHDYVLQRFNQLRHQLEAIGATPKNTFSREP